MAGELRDERVDLDVVSSERVYEGAVWDVRSDTVRYGDGQMTRQYVEHPGAAAVVALSLNRPSVRPCPAF